MKDFKKLAYDILKWVSLVGLPALIVLITTLSGIWGWTWSPAVCASISAVDVCVGTWIGVVFTKEEQAIDGGIVIDKDGNIVDIVADEEGKDITTGKKSVKLTVMKEDDNPYAGNK